jgi:hypothetical protein
MIILFFQSKSASQKWPLFECPPIDGVKKLLVARILGDEFGARGDWIFD